MATRKPMMAGNWKMHKNAAEAVDLVRAIGNDLDGSTAVEVVVCPPFTALKSVGVTLEYDKYEIKLGAQNVFWEDEGAYTGEISPLMLKQLDVEYVIVGHSERRQFFGETNDTVNKRLHAALGHGLKPILCVGENLEERESGRTTDVVAAQIKGGLAGIDGDFSESLVIAYEPIWAIGTGRVAEPEDANEVIRHIREVVGSLNGAETAQKVRILYGGSVKPGNVSRLMEEPEIDGALVGGASLSAEDFVSLIKY